VSRFANLSVAQLLESLSSSEPTPGGGTASAIVGAMGVSLLMMVAALAKSRTNTDEEKASLAKASAALGPVRTDLMRLADADSAAFEHVMAAFRLPKSTDVEKSARTAAVQLALQGATTTPLETLRACAEALRYAIAVAAAGNRSAASDVGVAIGFLEAAAIGAEANVRTNLPGLKDEAFTTGAASEAQLLASDAVASARDARQAVAG